MSNPVLQAIADRRSNRGYEAAQITKEQLDILLAAAEQAPSARNSQAWHFTVVQNKELIAEINEECKKAMNREGDVDVFYSAPTVIFISYDPEAHPWAYLDCGIAVQNIALAAHSIGLGSVIIGMAMMAFGGDKASYFAEKLKFPENFKFGISISVGTPNVTKDAHPILEDRIDIIE